MSYSHVMIFVVLAFLGVTWFILRAMPEPEADPDGCPSCGHTDGIEHGQCAYYEPVSGWADCTCRCRDDWHMVAAAA